MNKLLHGPTVQLKEMAGNGQPEHVGLIRKLFGLSDTGDRLVECAVTIDASLIEHAELSR